MGPVISIAYLTEGGVGYGHQCLNALLHDLSERKKHFVGDNTLKTEKWTQYIGLNKYLESCKLMHHA